MGHLRTLVAMQLKDKVNIDLLQNKKELLRSILFIALKFIIVAGITYGVLYLCQYLGVFYYSESTRVMILVITFSLLLSLISCTKDLMNNLYFSEDNKVLITFPVNTNILFISKLIVFYIYEIKRSLGFLIPIIVGSAVLLVTRGLASPLVFLWMWFPIIFIVGIPVLLGALLSIPAMYVYRAIKKYTITEILLFVLICIGATFLIVDLVRLIPSNINLINQWPAIKVWIQSFLLNVENKLIPMRQLIRIIVGEQATADSACYLTFITFLKFIALIAFDAILVVLVYYASRPLFFRMMAKNFEMNKTISVEHKNHKHSKYGTFLNKELKINLRTLSISINYIVVYLVVPILIMLLNALYQAMETNFRGDVLKYTFNILIMCLPMLASNALVATYYSREGRAGYLKKVKPIYALYPLFAKLFFNLILSIPSIFTSAIIFSHTSGFSLNIGLIVGFSVLFLHYGHMIWSATLDIMNPQNEQYATTGAVVDNPNETKSTLLAFITSFAFALLAYFFLSEAGAGSHDFTKGFIRLILIGFAYMASLIYLFVRKVRAYYYDQERR